MPAQGTASLRATPWETRTKTSPSPLPQGRGRDEGALEILSLQPSDSIVKEPSRFPRRNRAKFTSATHSNQMRGTSLPPQGSPSQSFRHLLFEHILTLNTNEFFLLLRDVTKVVAEKRGIKSPPGKDPTLRNASVSLQNQPIRVESKPATPRRLIRIGLFDASKAFPISLYLLWVPRHSFPM